MSTNVLKKIEKLCADVSTIEKVYENHYKLKKEVITRPEHPEEFTSKINNFHSLAFEKQEHLSQIERETELIKEGKICRAGNDSIIELLRSMGGQDLKKYLVDNVFDPNVIAAYKCMLDEIVDSPDDDGITKRIKIHHFMTGVKRIGTASANGVAMRASVGNVNDHHKKDFGVVIAKVARNPFKSPEMCHEGVVGMALAKLRAKCVHFLSVFETIFEGAPVESEQGQIVQMAVPGEEQVSYALYESVNEPVSISEAKSRDEMLLMLTQAICGLIIANDEIEFTHYDAHDENVLLYNYSDKEFYIKYNIRGFVFYLKSLGKFPMFIDYGMSHVVIEGNHYGVIDPSGWFSALTIYNDLPNYVSDVFKLVCMTARTLQDNIDREKRSEKRSPKEKEEYLRVKGECLDVCLRILGYFFGVQTPGEHDKPEIDSNGNARPRDANYAVSREDFAVLYNKGWDSRFHVPVELVNNRKWKMADVLTHCLSIISKTIPGGFEPENPGNVLGETHKTSSLKDALIKMGVEDVKVVNAEDLYLSKNTNEKDKIRVQFLTNIPGAIVSDERRLVPLFAYNWDGVFIRVEEERRDITPKIKADLEENLTKLAKFVQTMSDIRDNLDILEYALTVTPDHEYKPLYDRLKEKYTHLFVYVHKYKHEVELARDMLSNMVLGSTESPTSNEIQIAMKREKKRAEETHDPSQNLYALYDKYKNVAGSFLELLQRP